GRVADRLHRSGYVAGAVGADELERHQPHHRADAGHAAAVSGDRADDAGHVRAVAVVVRWGVVVVGEVPAPPVVDVAVVVVVDAVVAAARAVLPRVDPEVAGQVGMGQVDAGVDDADGDAAAAGSDAPGLARGDVGSWRTGREADHLAGVLEPPLAGEQRVVGR